MLDTLYGKTFLILGSQLAVTWLSTLAVLAAFRYLYRARVGWVHGGADERGNLDLELDWDTIRPYFWALLAADIIVFLALFFLGQSDLALGLPLFTFWSILTGIELALSLTAVDENLGARVLALTTLMTAAAGMIGMWSGIDFAFLETGLFIALFLLFGAILARILYSMPRWQQRLWAFFGSIVFTGYLLYDFHRLARQSEDAAANDWPTAMDIAINIYLDVINLFLQLLDLLSQ